MPYAYLTPSGDIAETALKPNPFRRLVPGERVVAYNPPPYDALTQVVEPVLPVPAEANAVTFTVQVRPDAEANLLRKVDAEVDHIYALAIGNRGPEYTQAELEATAFKDAGYTGTVPGYVASWAVSGNLTPTQAADSILATALQWRQAAAAIRAARLQAKAKIRSGDPTAMLEWAGFVAAIRSSLGV